MLAFLLVNTISSLLGVLLHAMVASSKISKLKEGQIMPKIIKTLLKTFNKWRYYKFLHTATEAELTAFMSRLNQGIAEVESTIKARFSTRLANNCVVREDQGGIEKCGVQ